MAVRVGTPVRPNRGSGTKHVAVIIGLDPVAVRIERFVKRLHTAHALRLRHFAPDIHGLAILLLLDHALQVRMNRGAARIHTAARFPGRARRRFRHRRQFALRVLQFANLRSRQFLVALHLLELLFHPRKFRLLVRDLLLFRRVEAFLQRAHFVVGRLLLLALLFEFGGLRRVVHCGVSIAAGEQDCGGRDEDET